MNPDDDPNGNPDDVVIPVVEEEVTAGVKSVKTGSIRVDKHIDKSIRRIEMPLVEEEVEVRRVTVNRVITEAPPVRRKGDVTIIPVVEEEVVITKRLILKEEVHLIRRKRKTSFIKDVELERERAEVHKLDAAGRDVDKLQQRGPARRTAIRSVLD